MESRKLQGSTIEEKEEELSHLYEFPGSVDSQKIGKDQELTIGDLHGNALKLVWFLIKHGFIEGFDESLYSKLVEHYKNNNLEKFNKIIDENLKINLNAGKLRLIGDELCDRGSNDGMTLCILEKLSDANKKPIDSAEKSSFEFEIIFSNHTAWFFEWLQKIKGLGFSISEKILNSDPEKENVKIMASVADAVPYAAHLSKPKQGTSLLNFSETIDSIDKVKKL